MINQIKMFFDEHMKLSAPEQDSAEQLQIACAALFLEMMSMDDMIDNKEQQAVESILKQNFSLSAEQTSALLELAEKQRGEATDYFQFTSLINKQYTLEQKTHLLLSLWKIAFVDGVLDMHEEYLVRKIADLLHVPHVKLLMTKNLAAQSPQGNHS